MPNKLGLTPLPGKMIIEPMSAQDAIQGGIIIPDSALMVLGNMGVVLVENPVPNGIYGFVDKTVLVHGGIGLEYEWKGRSIRICPLDINYIIGVFYEGRWSTPSSFMTFRKVESPGEQGVERCRRCRSKGKLNIIMAHGYCPVCKLDRLGRPRPTPTVEEDSEGNKRVIHTSKVSDAEVEELGGTGPKKAKGTIFSFPK
jgi:hypothetical protein